MPRVRVARSRKNYNDQPPGQRQLTLLSSIQPAEHYCAVHSQQRFKSFIYQLKDGKLLSALVIDPRIFPTIHQILNPFAGQTEIYFSLSQFHSRRVSDKLAKINCFFVDLDRKLVESKNFDWRIHDNDFDAINTILTFVESIGIPLPGYIVSTSNGYHLYWILENESFHAYLYWSLLQKDLVELLRPIGADPACVDATRIARLTGSIHSRTNKTVTFYRICNGRSKWKIREIFAPIYDAYKSKFYSQNTQEVNRKRDYRVKNFNSGWKKIASYFSVVVEDLVKIAEAQPGQKIPVGLRDLWLYFMAVAQSYICCDSAQLMESILFYGRKYTTLTDDEIYSYSSACRKRAEKYYKQLHLYIHGIGQEPKDERYKLQSQTLVRVLAPIVPPGLWPQLRAILPPSLKKSRKQAQNAYHNHAGHPSRRNRRLDPQTKAQRYKARLAGNYQQMLPLIAEAERLAAQQLPQTTIAQRLGVNQSTISRWLKPI